MQRYDVIIVGASFAGLAAATELHGLTVLLVDRKEIGTHVTSACGAPHRFLKEFDLLPASLQTHQSFHFQIGRRHISFPLPEPFVTFDYGILCRRLFSQSQARFLKASATAITATSVTTSAGVFEADFVIDATGWKAVSLPHRRTTIRQLASALESEVDESRDAGLHFMVHTPHSPGCFWVFPAGPYTRYGLGEYVATQKSTKTKLVHFMKSFGQKPHEFHGNVICTDFRPPVENGIFLAGESAGQCIPLSYEGIRPSVYFGKAAGRVIRAIRHGQISREDGIRRYMAFAEAHRRVWTFFGRLEWLVSRSPLWFTHLVFLFLQRKDRWLRNFGRYMRAFSIDRLNSFSQEFEGVIPGIGLDAEHNPHHRERLEVAGHLDAAHIDRIETKVF